MEQNNTVDTTVEQKNQEKINLQEKADKLKVLAESSTLFQEWLKEVMHFPGKEKAAQYLIDIREQRKTLEAKQKAAEKNA